MRARALLTGASLALLVTAAACDGARKPPFLPEASPTVTAESSAPAERGGIEGFREFAALIDEEARAGDGSLMEDRTLGSVNYATGDVEFRGEPPERARSSFAYLTSEALPGEVDEFGGGEASLYAIARRAKDSPGDEELYQGILTAIVPDDYGVRQPRRNVAVYEFAFRNGIWRLVTILMNPHWGESVYPYAGAWLRGECDICFDQWERWEGTN